jgi:hypothetical protein
MNALAGPAAGVVIAMECVVALCVALRGTRRTGFMLGTGLFSVFALVVYGFVRTRPGTSCGCTFAIGAGRADILHVALNGLLALLCLFLWRSLPEQPPERRPEAS